MNCVHCGSPNAGEGKFCRECGASLLLRCSKCESTNPPASKFCGCCGTKLANAPGDQIVHPPLGADADKAAERRQLIVLFCDLVGSTALSTKLDPEDLREIMDVYRRCITATAARFGGFVARHLGDGTLMYFGYPYADEFDAERAIQAGLSLIERVAALRTQEPLSARVGIAYGLVLVGNLSQALGAEQHDVLGETPNLAARLQGLAQPGKVVVSDLTKRIAGPLFKYRDLGASPIKGFDQPVQAWEVISSAEIATHSQALEVGDLLPLIGREEELELLQRRWDQAKRGDGRVVLIYGEPGIGKSRLVFALQETIKAAPHRYLRFYCSPHRIQTALYPAINQLEHAAGFAPGDDNEAKLEKLATLLALSSQDVAGDLALFGELLSIPSRGKFAALSVSAQRRKELILESFISQLVGLAARAPVLMVLEDAHWVDPTTRELFDIAVERVRTLPVLLIITYRPEFAPPWLGQSHVTVLTLNRLGRRENAAMIRQVAKGKKFPAALLEQIVAQTDGVPLFIEEMTKSVLESDVLREENGGYVLSNQRPVLAIPSTLQASLVARLDRLAPLRAVVQAAAALGREFSYGLLRAVSDLPDSELKAMLDQLVASELVHERGTVPHAVYTFKHALVQDAAYETMLKSQRTQMHSRIVEVFEHEFPELVVHNPDVLAYHCTEAGLYSKAIDYWLTATRMALERSAGVEARAQVEKAKTLLPKISEAAARRQFEGCVQVALGDTLIMTQGFASPEVARALFEARGLLDESVHPIESLRALNGLCNYHLIRSESPQSLKLAQSFLQRPIDSLSVAVHLMIGTAHLHIGSFKDAQHHLERALSLYEEDACRPIAFTGGFHVRSFTLIWLSLTYLYLGKLKQAVEMMAAAVTDARSRLHPFTLVSALLASARFFNHTRNLQGAVAATDEGLAIATEQRSPYHISRAKILHAVNVVESGRPLEGISLMDHALVEHRKTGANFQSSFNLSCLAEAHARTGDFERALDLASAAIQEIDHSGERWWAAEAQRLRGNILLAARVTDWREAENCFQVALECAQNQQAKFWELRAAYSLASLWNANGLEAEARKLLGPICGEFTDGVDMPDLNDAKQFLNELRRPASG